MRAMLFEGVFLELCILFLTSMVQSDIERLSETKSNSSWSFILNILTTVIEIIATLGDLTIVKFEYDG